MIPKALLTAATDPELRPGDLAVYVHLHEHLDYLTYRRLKQKWLARVLHLDRSTLSRAMARLLDGGYLELCPEDSGGRGAASRYRIPYSPDH